MEETESSFADDMTLIVTLALQTTHKEKMHTETLLVMHTYSTMTLTIKIPSHSETNIQHYYNKNYKIHIGIYMAQL